MVLAGLLSLVMVATPVDALDEDVPSEPAKVAGAAALTLPVLVTTLTGSVSAAVLGATCGTTCLLGCLGFYATVASARTSTPNAEWSGIVWPVDITGLVAVGFVLAQGAWAGVWLTVGGLLTLPAWWGLRQLTPSRPKNGPSWLPESPWARSGARTGLALLAAVVAGGATWVLQGVGIGVGTAVVGALLMQIYFSLFTGGTIAPASLSPSQVQFLAALAGSLALGVFVVSLAGPLVPALAWGAVLAATHEPIPQKQGPMPEPQD